MLTTKYASYIVSPAALLIVLMSAYVGLWASYPQEIIASDPLIYSRNAYSLSIDASSYLNNPASKRVFGHRLGVSVPVAFIYKVLGVNIYTTNLWPLCAVLLIFVGVYAALPTAKSKAFGVCFCFGSIMLFKSSIALYPDIICSALMFLATIFLFYRKRAEHSGWLQYGTPILAMTFLFFAFLAKESAYWALPIWFYALGIDIKNKDYGVLKRFYVPAIATGLVLGIAYLLFCYAIWDDCLARLRAVEAVSGKHAWLLKDASTAEWVRRLTRGPFRMLRAEYGLMITFSAIGVWFVPKTHRLWVYYSLCIALFYWFGSVSLSSYQPMPLVPRMTVPLLPGLLIVSALFAALLCSLPTYPPWFQRTIAASIVILTILPLGAYLKTWDESDTAESQAMSIVKAEVLSKSNQSFLLLCSDERSPRSLAFHFGFQYPKNLVVQSIESFLKEPEKRFDNHYVIINHHRSKFLKRAYKLINFDEEIEAMNFPACYAAGEIKLFHPTSSKPLKTEMARLNRKQY